MRTIKPPRLRKGDVIGLICPASPPDQLEKIEAGARYLEKLGYRVKLSEHIHAKLGYLAGTDEQRAADFNEFVRDPQVKAVFAVRGGYGTPRLLPLIDYRALRRNPKIISGFSDLTGLQLAITRKTGLVTFSGPMPGVEFWKSPDPYTEEMFWALLTKPRNRFELLNPPDSPLRPLKPGKMSGPLIGGNLSLVTNLIGTPFLPNFRNALLVLEEVDEPAYRIDRMLTQLRNAGILSQLAGLALGQFTGWVPKDPAKPHRTLDEIKSDLTAWTSGGILDNLQYGHIPKKLTIPWGIRAECTRPGHLVLTEPAVT